VLTSLFISSFHFNSLINAVFLIIYRDRERGEAKELRAYNETKKQLKADRASGKGRTLAEEDEDARGRGGDDELDALLARVRDFLADLKPSGEKRERRGADQPNKLRLTQAFEAYDPANKGTLAKDLIVKAFTSAGFSPTLTGHECDKLVGALDAWDPRETKTVAYRRFLTATYAIESVSVHGIFPRVRQREPSKYETERKAKAEEEERKALAAAEEERTRRDQAHTKMLAGQARAGAGRAKGPTKEDLRRS
jgi:hypothetical protein